MDAIERYLLESDISIQRDIRNYNYEIFMFNSFYTEKKNEKVLTPQPTANNTGNGIGGFIQKIIQKIIRTISDFFNMITNIFGGQDKLSPEDILKNHKGKINSKHDPALMNQHAQEEIKKNRNLVMKLLHGESVGNDKIDQMVQSAAGFLHSCGPAVIGGGVAAAIIFKKFKANGDENKNWLNGILNDLKARANTLKPKKNDQTQTPSPSNNTNTNKSADNGTPDSNNNQQAPSSDNTQHQTSQQDVNPENQSKINKLLGNISSIISQSGVEWKNIFSDVTGVVANKATDAKESVKKAGEGIGNKVKRAGERVVDAAIEQTEKTKRKQNRKAVERQYRDDPEEAVEQNQNTILN